MLVTRIKINFELFNEILIRNMNNNTNTTLFVRDDELLYFNGDIYKPKNSFFHNNIWMVLTFLIQGIGVLMNSYLVSMLSIVFENI